MTEHRAVVLAGVSALVLLVLWVTALVRLRSSRAKYEDCRRALLRSHAGEIHPAPAPLDLVSGGGPLGRPEPYGWTSLDAEGEALAPVLPIHRGGR